MIHIKESTENFIFTIIMILNFIALSPFFNHYVNILGYIPIFLLMALESIILAFICKKIIGYYNRNKY